MSGSLGVWPVRIEAQRLAAVLAQRLGGDLFRPWEREESQKSQFREIFRQRSQWVLVMATGIATRFVEGLWMRPVGMRSPWLADMKGARTR